MNLTLKLFFILNIFLLNLNCYPINRIKRHAWAYSNRISIGCISINSFVKLNLIKEKQINLLNSGDSLLTMNRLTNKLISTEMIMMLDNQPFKENYFYRIKSESNHEISLTEYHLIPIEYLSNQTKYLFAKQIQIGDLIFVVNRSNSSEIIRSKVIEIRNEILRGYSSPLTIEGTLIVNDIVVSSYAHVSNHLLAHQSMSFIRFIYHLSKYFNRNKYLFENSFQNLYSFSLICLLNIFDFFTKNLVFI